MLEEPETWIGIIAAIIASPIAWEVLKRLLWGPKREYENRDDYLDHSEEAAKKDLARYSKIIEKLDTRIDDTEAKLTEVFKQNMELQGAALIQSAKLEAAEERIKQLTKGEVE